MLPQLRRRRTLALAVAAIALLGLAAVIFCPRRSAPALHAHPRQPLLVGAHYYSWFPENWAAGYSGQHYTPPVKPQLGEYASSDPAVFAQHVAWAKAAGINFFIFDFWPRRTAIRQRIDGYLRQGIAPGFQFCLLYEIHDLKEPGEHPISGEPANVVFLSDKRAARMKKTWRALADSYMSHPQYLRIDGRPVLFVYATRHLVGDVPAAIQEARRYVKEKTGADLYLVADEVYWNTLGYDPQKGVYMREALSADTARIAAFDALTSYNPYDVTRPQHRGSAGFAQFLADSKTLYQTYFKRARDAGKTFIPGALAAYNDRGVRLEEDHFVIPRYESGDISRPALLRQLDELTPLLDPYHPMVTITSWNEWNEGSQIEPAAPSPASSGDDSGQETYSQHELSRGYGVEDLNALQRTLATLREKMDGHADPAHTR